MLGRDVWRIWEQGNGYCEPTEAERAKAIRHWRRSFRGSKDFVRRLPVAPPVWRSWKPDLMPATSGRFRTHSVNAFVRIRKSRCRSGQARACERGMYAVTMAQAASWDDVFGRPHEGHKIPALRTQRALQYKVKKRVLELRRQRA